MWLLTLFTVALGVSAVCANDYNFLFNATKYLPGTKGRSFDAIEQLKIKKKLISFSRLQIAEQSSNTYTS